MSVDLGVNLPSDADGTRSSTTSALTVLAASVVGVDDVLAADLRAATDWRHRYPELFTRLLIAEAQSADAALRVARQGLAAAREHYVVVGAGGSAAPLSSAVDAHKPGLRTVAVSGHDERVRELVVPYRGENLRGLALLRQLDDWVRRGIVEPTFAEAVGAVVRHPEWLDLRDRTFALVGAGAQMGPFAQLVQWGARVAAIDLPRPDVWTRLLATVRESAGTMYVPVPGGREDPTQADIPSRAGANLLTDVGPLVDWLTGLSGPMTIGNYGYADGVLFVRLSVAFGALLDGLRARRDDLSVTYLATPSDAFLVPVSAVDMAQERHSRQSPLLVAGKLAHTLSIGRWFAPNYGPGGVIETPTERFGVVSAFIVAQGPNYAMAKRLQRWQMIATRADGILTSVHVAPPTRTGSVHSNPLMAERQRLTAFVGIETFDAPTTEAIAGAILVHDLHNPASPANPATPLGHPHEAFMFAANPGGRWRVPFDVGSTVPLLHEITTARLRAETAIRGVPTRIPGLSRVPGASRLASRDRSAD
jgi:hypothetical protein